jgi:hypothetical protein
MGCHRSGSQTALSIGAIWGALRVEQVETDRDLSHEKLKEISFAPPISSGVFPGRRLFLLPCA